MWVVTNQDIRMTEGDFGIELPITISGAEFGAGDEVKLTIKATANGEAIIEKTFSNIAQNTFNLVFTAEETALLPVGKYVYVLDWYQDGAFMCNIVTGSSIRVVDKA